MVRTELYIDGANGTDGFLSFPFGVNIPVSLNFNLADVRNPEQRKASFSKTINLLGTNEVNKLFENLFEVNVVTQYFNKNLKTPVKYLVDGLENFAGDLQLIKVNINPDNSIVYECSIIGAGGSLFVDIGEKYIIGNTNSLDDLDFSAYDHNYTRANQIASRTSVGTGLGYAYPFIDRGTNGGGDTVWSVKDFLPTFSVYEYVKKIIENTGRTFTSTFLNSSFFKHLYCYSNVTELNASLAQQQASQLYVGLNTNVNLTIVQNYVTYPTTNIVGANYNLTAFNNESTLPFFDTGNQNLNGIITFAYTKNFNVVYHQKLKLKFNYFDPSLPSAVATTVKVVAPFYMHNLIQKSAVANTWYNLNGNNQNLYFGQNWTQVSNAQQGLLQFTFTINTDYFEVVDLATGTVQMFTNDRLRQIFLLRHLYNYLDNNGDPIAEYTYYDAGGNELDPIGGIISMESVSGALGSSSYALNSQTTLVEGDLLEVNNSLPTKIKQKEFLTSILRAFNLFVEVNPNNPNDLLIEPFDEFYNTTNIVNYENRTDLNKEQTINPNLLEGKRYIYTYKADKDHYNELYFNTHNEVFGTEQIDVDNDFIKSDKKTELIFSATPLVGNYGLGIAQSRIYKQEEQGGVVVKKTIAANIRLLYLETKTSPNAYTYKQQGLADITTNEYLHAGMEDDALNPTVSLMFGPAKEFYYNYINAYFTTNTLYNKYHKQYLVNLIDRDAKFVTKYLWLTPKDINEFSFRNRLFIDGSYYIVNKIENYTPLDQTSTKVELIKLLDTEAFVPESILISDSSVDAGSEVYTARLNSSLNVGTNIQNRGANCLAIGENIVIPESCTNLIVFGSNITADENSTGLLLNYKSYVALITQTGTAAPTAIVLENTLGEVTFNYISVGNYEVVTSGLFTGDKTFALIPNSRLGTNFIYQVSTNVLQIVCRDITSDTPFIPFRNDALNKTSIEIRVYN